VKDLKNKVVMITGGSKGLGFVIAKHLVKEQCKLALCARSFEELEAARNEIRKLGAEALIAVCDVANKDAVDEFTKKVINHFGRIDILVNDAGIIIVGAMESFGPDEYHEAMDIMYWGIVHTTLSVLPHMKEKKVGQIINITSVGGKVSIPHLLPYSAAKFAAVGFSEGMAAELRKDHIYVTTVIPGLMRTGSYVNAYFQKDNKKEFKLFSLISTVPLVTISADSAARQTIKAMKNKKAMKVLGLPAKALIEFHHFFPETTTRFFGLVTKLLPASKGKMSFEKGENIRLKYKDSELPGFELIGKYVQQKHQPNLKLATSNNGQDSP
jgi:short-subunit dehydrogenase